MKRFRFRFPLQGGWPTLAGFARAGALFLSALREIFDENAYTRFLQQRQLQPSRASYRDFLRENAIRRERRARCC
jgi:hypothetical protein